MESLFSFSSKMTFFGVTTMGLNGRWLEGEPSGRNICGRGENKMKLRNFAYFFFVTVPKSYQSN